MDHPWSEEREAARLERFKSITLEDVQSAREHIVAAPGDIVEIPVEYYDWLLSQLEAARTEIRKAVGIMGGDVKDGDTLVELVAVTESGMHNALSLLDTSNMLIAAQGDVIAAQNDFIQTLRKGREDKKSASESQADE